MAHKLLINGEEIHELPGHASSTEILSQLTSAISDGSPVTIPLGDGEGLIINGALVTTAKVVERAEGVAGAGPRPGPTVAEQPPVERPGPET